MRLQPERRCERSPVDPAAKPGLSSCAAPAKRHALSESKRNERAHLDIRDWSLAAGWTVRVCLLRELDETFGAHRVSSFTWKVPRQPFIDISRREGLEADRAVEVAHSSAFVHLCKRDGTLSVWKALS